ncbi:ferrous iron transport protein A [Alginatibacterium sediminis]|uniref:Ferrous iron transport protein A n=2 Tax=Alginatibacterium sediminis TaxID=2164068 RepID=A0A420EBU7_9ALTE|nr:ferrous iron transport protein A [Alginatibacterium sediminis]
MQLFQACDVETNIEGGDKSLFEAQLNRAYTIKAVESTDKEIVDFLFTLGCYKGESVSVISVLSDTYVIAVKDARYSIDADLSKAILLF